VRKAEQSPGQQQVQQERNRREQPTVRSYRGPSRYQEVGYIKAENAQQPTTAEHEHQSQRQGGEERIPQLPIAFGILQLSRPYEYEWERANGIHRDENRHDHPHGNTQP
jgi:hypothetical protein